MLVLLTLPLATVYVPILTTLSIPATCMALHFKTAVPTGTIGRPRRALTTPTAWASIASPQARTSVPSTAGGWSVASLAHKNAFIRN